jgi:Ca-activated chloride channel family protein
VDFSHPEWLWLLIPWALVAARSGWGRRRRHAAWEALGQRGKPPADGRVGVILAGFWLVVALAQPRWGRDPSAAIPPGRDVVFLIDVSRSMGAEDAVPDRLGVAIESAGGLIDAMASEGGDRVAVVAFAGVGVVRCGLTENLGAALDVIRRLKPGTVQPGGTDLGGALQVAVGAFDDRDHADGRMIVVFTDGEDLAGGWRERVDSLRREGIIVNAVAIGDPDQGHPVPGPSGAITYQGKPVESRRSDEALDALANGTGGAVIRLGLASADLGSLYRDTIAPAARRVRNALHPPERAERYGLFVVAALLCLTIGARPRRVRQSSRRWGLIAGLGLLFAIGAGPSAESPRRLVERGREAFRAGRYDDALAAFDAAAILAPRSAVPRFDAAATLYALGRYPKAIERYHRAGTLGDVEMKIKVAYALGNATLMAGDPASAIEHYDACIAAPSRSTALDAVRRDARANRDYALQRLADRDANTPEPEPEPESPKPEAPKPKPSPKADEGKEQNPDSEGPRGQGGAGGNEPDPGPKGGQVPPEQRLESALENVREALKNRLPDVPLKQPSGDLRDW